MVVTISPITINKCKRQLSRKYEKYLRNPFLSDIGDNRGQQAGRTLQYIGIVTRTSYLNDF